MFSYSTGYYVSPPDDQYLKFKNRCSLMSICYMSSISVLLYMYIPNCVHIMFKIWYITIILSYLLLCAVHLMQGFV
jgi:hypothetical protein